MVVGRRCIRAIILDLANNGGETKVDYEIGKAATAKSALQWMTAYGDCCLNKIWWDKEVRWTACQVGIPTSKHLAYASERTRATGAEADVEAGWGPKFVLCATKELPMTERSRSRHHSEAGFSDLTGSVMYT